MTLFCVWEGTHAHAHAQPPPPVPKCKANCKAMRDAICKAGCNAKWEEWEWMKYPHRLPMSYPQAITLPNPKCHICKKTKKVLSHCENLAVSWDRLKPSTTNKGFTNEQANTNHHHGSNTDQPRSITSLYLTHSYGWSFLYGRIVCGIRWILCACFGLSTKPFLRG